MDCPIYRPVDSLNRRESGKIRTHKMAHMSRYIPYLEKRNVRLPDRKESNDMALHDSPLSVDLSREDILLAIETLEHYTFTYGDMSQYPESEYPDLYEQIYRINQLIDKLRKELDK